MLRVNSGSRVAADSDFNGLQIVSNLLAVVRRRKWLIAAIAASIAGLSAFYALSATPLFIAEGQLLIDTQQSRSLDLGDGGGVSISADAGMIDSQVEILKSERIIKAVIKELKLVEAMKDRLAAQAANDKVPGFLKAIFPFWFQQAQLSDFELERRVIDGLKANIKVQRVGASFAILLSHKSPDGQRSADIVNQQAESYIRPHAGPASGFRIGSLSCVNRRSQPIGRCRISRPGMTSSIPDAAWSRISSSRR